ncbi:hypothetical protein BC952_1342 [Flavobacterium limicola]|uniref:Uncharacterized protein n=1 Tax=Flavobacterium limicola TaxID=180441 RepID=A0A495S900_9FLAO|nr:DUF6629 family protein [Flavobacterium limicola]RKS95646.1 hypothetical protein BC952_1342 [Flavobacterium limicola]
MCFSASASFGAAIVLSVISVGTIKNIQHTSHFYFAGIPLIFCLQQASEGFLWLSLTNSSYASLQQPMTYIFLFFAQILWPTWIPFALLKLEKSTKRKKFESILLLIGILVSCYQLYLLIGFPSEAKIIGHHILYQHDYPVRFGNYGDLLYFSATIIPTFISSIKRMWLLGLFITIAYVITALLYTKHVISVWCFFASIISILILFILQGIKNKDKQISDFAKV